jgi:hypothetical protein
LDRLLDIAPNARITTTVNYDGNGRRISYSYKWEGPEDGIVGVSFDLLRDADPAVTKQRGDILVIGPYRLRIIGEGYMSPAVYAMRDGWNAVARIRVIWLWHLLDKIYRRAVMTCAVWGLAERPAGVVPTWRDVHALRRLARAWRWFNDPFKVLDD